MVFGCTGDSDGNATWIVNVKPGGYGKQAEFVLLKINRQGAKNAKDIAKEEFSFAGSRQRKKLRLGAWALIAKAFFA